MHRRPNLISFLMGGNVRTKASLTVRCLSINFYYSNTSEHNAGR